MLLTIKFINPKLFLICIKIKRLKIGWKLQIAQGRLIKLEMYEVQRNKLILIGMIFSFTTIFQRFLIILILNIKRNWN
jgi:hypothetical protein